MDTQILMTTNYSLFKKFNGNREINQANVRRIAASMRDKYLVRPIDVNENHEVIDGQHRLEACKIVGLPVYYVVHKGWGLDEAQRLNATQRVWKTNEYINGYCKAGLKEYLDLRDLINSFHELPFQVILSCSIGVYSRPSSQALNDFRSGTFRFANKKKAEQILFDMMRFKPYHQCFKSATFCWALLSAIGNDGFIFDEFLLKTAYQSRKLDGCTTHKHYLSSIEDIYNYKRRGERLRLL